MLPLDVFRREVAADYGLAQAAVGLLGKRDGGFGRIGGGCGQAWHLGIDYRKSQAKVYVRVSSMLYLIFYA